MYRWWFLLSVALLCAVLGCTPSATVPTPSPAAAPTGAGR